VTFTYFVGDEIDIAMQETTISVAMNSLTISHDGQDVTGQIQQTIVGMGIAMSVGLVGPGLDENATPLDLGASRRPAYDNRRPRQ
jgi:hypothetical protein